MTINLQIKGRKTELEYNGKKSTHKTVYLKSLTVNDFLTMLEQNELKSL